MAHSPIGVASISKELLPADYTCNVDESLAIFIESTQDANKTAQGEFICQKEGDKAEIISGKLPILPIAPGSTGWGLLTGR